MSREKANERINLQSIPNNGKKTHTGIIIVTAVVVCVLAGIILYLMFGKESEPEEYNRVITPENVEEVLSQLGESEKTPVGSYEATMNSEWTFEDGETVSKDAYVKNSLANRNTVYFTVTLKEDRSEVFKSPHIPVGSELKDIKLDKDLDAGRYDAVLTYHLLDDKGKELTTVSLALVLTVNK